MQRLPRIRGAERGDTVPILAGTDAAYFKKAIADYASGRRPSPEMEPYAKMVTHFGVDDIAGYFAAQKRQPTPVRSTRRPSRGARRPRPRAPCAMGPTGRGTGRS